VPWMKHGRMRDRRLRLFQHLRRTARLRGGLRGLLARSGPRGLPAWLQRIVRRRLARIRPGSCCELNLPWSNESLAERKAASGNFEPMRRQVEAWQKTELTYVTAEVVIYEALAEGKSEAPKHLAPTLHDCTSNQSAKNSSRERSGVSRMRSPHLVFFFSSTDGTIQLLMGYFDLNRIRLS